MNAAHNVAAQLQAQQQAMMNQQQQSPFSPELAKKLQNAGALLGPAQTLGGIPTAFFDLLNGRNRNKPS